MQHRRWKPSFCPHMSRGGGWHAWVQRLKRGTEHAVCEWPAGPSYLTRCWCLARCFHGSQVSTLQTCVYQRDTLLAEVDRCGQSLNAVMGAAEGHMF